MNINNNHNRIPTEIRIRTYSQARAVDYGALSERETHKKGGAVHFTQCVHRISFYLYYRFYFFFIVWFTKKKEREKIE